jgi:hypothetical protein
MRTRVKIKTRVKIYFRKGRAIYHDITYIKWGFIIGNKLLD